MRRIFILFFLILSELNLFAQINLPFEKSTNSSFPTNFNEEKYITIKQFDGTVIAFDGVIKKIEKSRKKTPFYKLKIGTSGYLWTVLMFNNKANKTGDTIRVVGYLNPMPAELSESEKRYLDGKYMVLALGMVDFKNCNYLFLRGADKQRQEWLDGKIPGSH